MDASRLQLSNTLDNYDTILDVVLLISTSIAKQSSPVSASGAEELQLLIHCLKLEHKFQFLTHKFNIINRRCLK